ncbi:pancreatic secretory trypsin inhibitor-like [Chiroxiphia lanceolata]|uniref:pancreatic secretory trypsin inhibitor-like n=1 Tax=Chiroxiphia lanceolata TaxID=296741 RepID=UPI0013CF14FF|nr:pancreatic secretory trypsin inhibitor-like [Chiroxiphia lanceolata]
MKATGIFLLLSLALCCYQGIAEANRAAGRGTEPACDNFNLSRGCSRIFEPICGTDDVLYSNECLLCLQNRQRGANVRIKHRGMCQKPSARSAE